MTRDSHFTPPTQTGEPAANSLARHTAAHRDHLLAGMRSELLGELEAIVGYGQILADDSRDRPADMLDDLSSMQQAAVELYDFVRSLLDNHGQPERSADPWFRTLRHDVANRLNHIKGFCQLLLVDEHDRFFGAFAADLENILAVVRRCETILLRYKSAPQDAASQAETTFANVAALTAPPIAPPTPAHLAVDQPARVLVVDDSSTSRDILARILTRQGHSVAVAANGREALEHLEREEYDLLLLDLIMPEMNGYEVLRQLKADERLQHTPVIVVSALDAVNDMAPCIEIGADDFLIKPVDLTLLRARINACVERKRLREREFGQFFTPELARHLMRHPEVLREGRAAEVTVLFCDIRGFSRISERLGPTESVTWLSDVMAVLSSCVIRHRGVLVDYIGDELMAMWGAPEEQPNHAELACHAALDMLAQIPALDLRWRNLINDRTDIGIGINSGTARVGNTGSDRKFKYGPLGNAVNLASRVQGAAKYLGVNLLVTGETLDKVGNHIPCRRLCKVRVVNIQQPVELYEVHPVADTVLHRLKLQYEDALAAVEAGDFRRAVSLLGQLLVEQPDDAPSLLLMSRVVQAKLQPREPFDPVWELPGK